MMVSLFNYMSQHFSQITELLLEHIVMTVIAVGIAIVIGVPLGILISYVKKLSGPIVGAANVIQAVPSMALLGLAIPLLGIGTLPAVVMVNNIFAAAYHKKYLYRNIGHRPGLW